MPPHILDIASTLLPSKLRRLNPADDVPEHSTAEPAPSAPATRMTEPVNIPDHTTFLDSTRRPAATVDIQEEDSGLRMVDETNPDEQIVQVLPPAYSAD